MLWNKKLPDKITEEILQDEWEDFLSDICLREDSVITPKAFKRRLKHMIRILKLFPKDNPVKFDKDAHRRENA
jgi:hypothetical protein